MSEQDEAPEIAVSVGDWALFRSDAALNEKEGQMSELPIEQQQLTEKGSATLHSLHNVAYGTPGWHVLELVRKGIWTWKGVKQDGHGYNVITYGPAL
jgi:hypothetical protein